MFFISEKYLMTSTSSEEVSQNSPGTPLPSADNTFGHSITFAEAVRVWLRVALLSFGGPAGQIAVMHRILVDEKRWVSESRFLHALNYCMALPGPEAQQLATYLGWLLHGVKGGWWPAPCSFCPVLWRSWG